MAFQLTPLQIPNMRTDYGAENSAFANLGQTLGNLPREIRQEQLAAQKQQLLGSLAGGNTDYNKVGLGLLALGDTSGGASLLALGQKAKERQDQLDYYKNSPFGGGNPATPGATPSAAPTSLIQNESGGNWQAQNNATGAGGLKGHFGRLQFGQARLQEAAAAGALPAGTTPQAFMQSPELQQRAEAWHWGDIDNHIRQTGLDRAVGQTINGVPVTVEGMRAVAHLGGKEGLSKFIASGGRYNPADENGTRLSDYFARHGGGGGTRVASSAPGVQVAETEADVQRLEAQMPGYGGGPAVASITGDDPVKLRQEAARYQQSNPEAARQFLARAQAAEQAGGVQTAQAPASAQSDLPAQGAAPAQGFAIPQGQSANIPPNDPYPQVSTQQLLNVLRNPNAPAGEKEIAKQLFVSRQAYSAENAPDKREQSRLTTEKLRRDVEGVLTPEQEAQKIRLAQAGRTTITNANTFDGKGESKFNEALGTAQAKRWNGYIEEGDIAQNRIADIQTLRDASRRLGSQGSSANLKATIGPYAESLGIAVDGLSDIQLYESITNRLAPTLRAPGSGSTSDIEFKGFQRAIGPLSNTPAAREMILDTFEAASRNDIARAEIASRLAEGQINRGQAEKEIRSLPNPLEGFKKFREANPDLVGEAIKTSGMRQAAEKRDPVKVASPDEAKKLPSGTRIILPDGRQGQVP